LALAGITPRTESFRFHRYYGPIRLPCRRCGGYVFPSQRWALTPSGKGLSVPGFVCRHAPSPSTPESPAAACTRCLTADAGLVLFDGLATLTGLTRLNWVRLTLRLTPLSWRGFAGRITPSQRPLDYMANGSFQGKLLSVYKTNPVSLTHRRSEDAKWLLEFLRVLASSRDPFFMHAMK
jgi:hypothetical protein